MAGQSKIDPEDEYRDHVANINKRLVAREVALKKASQPADFGPGQRGELTKVKRKDDDPDVIDSASISESGEVTRS